MQKQIKAMVEKYREKMIWTPDKVLFGKYEHWVDLWENFEKDDVVKCDCEDFALSCCRAAFEQDLLSPDKFGLMLVSIKQTSKFDHCVAWFKPKQIVWIADNTSRRPYYKFSDMVHTAIQHNTYETPQDWFETVV